MSNLVLRSVSRLEDEIAELEREAGLAPAKEEEVKEVKEAPVKEEASHEEETFKKRYADLRRHSQKQADELKDLRAEIESLKQAPAAKADLTNIEQVKAWAEANPKAADIIRALAKEQAITTTQKINPKLDDFEKLKGEIEKERQTNKIVKAHPDFETITSSDEFHDWAETQPKSVQNLIYDGDADDVIWSLNLYKEALGTKKANPSKDAAKAVSVKGSNAAPRADTGKGRFSESAVQKMSMSEYEANEKAIHEEMRNGTFIYDLSGGAR